MADETPEGSIGSLDWLDRELESVRTWVHIAGHALATSFWSENAPPTATLGSPRDTQRELRVGFLRDTFSDGLGATSTFRSFGAIAEYIRFVQEHDLLHNGPPAEAFSWAPQLSEEPLEIADLVTRFAGTAADFVLSKDGGDISDNGANAFSDSHALLALAELLTLKGFEAEEVLAPLRGLKSRYPPVSSTRSRLFRRPSSSGSSESINSVSEVLAAEFIARITTSFISGRRAGEAGGRLLPTKISGYDIRSFPVHDFITLSAIRGVDAMQAVFSPLLPLPLAQRAAERFGQELEESRMVDAVLSRAMAQIGYEAAGVESRFDSGDLVFALALLDRLPIGNDGEIRAAGLRILQDRQGADGGWPTSRVLSHGQPRLLHIASYEYGMALTYIGLNRLRVGDLLTIEQLLPMVHRCFGLIRSNHVTVRRPVDWPIASRIANPHGWCNDHTQLEGLIESWATAIVLMFLQRYHKLLAAYRQETVLAKYDAYPNRPANEKPWAWPDLQWQLRQPTLLIPDADLARFCDPTPTGRLRQRLADEILNPIGTSLAYRPGICASLLIYGPPGTRKTSLVHVIGTALGWPVLTLAPPDFLRLGLEGLERTAAEVFRDLGRLQRVVVLFDECEEFFKKRHGEGERVESRTMGAFVTAGMLPRLQQLRDKRWLVFIAAMNTEPDQLDPAAIRPGRFDRQQRIDHPTLEAQRRYINDKAKPPEGSRQEDVKSMERAKRLLLVAAEHVDKMEVPGTVAASGSATTGVSFQILEKAWDRAKLAAASSGKNDDRLVVELSEFLSLQRISGPPELADG